MHTVTAQEVQVLAGLGQDGLGAELELAVGVLGKEERGEGGQKALHLNGLATSVLHAPVRDGTVGTDIHHIHTYAAQELGALVAQAQIKLREAVLIVVLALSGRAGGEIMVQVQHAGGKAEAGAQIHVCRQLGAAVEGIEGSARLQVVHVGHVGRHGMPGLADGKAHGAVVPAQLYEGLTQPQGGRRAAEVVEVRLHLAGNAHGAPLVAGHVQAQAGGEGHEAPVEAVVGVKAVCHVLALGHIEVKVFGSGVHGAGIGHNVVTDEAVQLEMRGFFLGGLRKSGAAGEQRCQ